MSHAARISPLTDDAPYLGPAIVREAENAEGCVSVRLGVDGPGQILSAQIAVPRVRPLAAGEEVLVTGDPAGQLYVIGVLSAPERRLPAQPKLSTAAGAYAAVRFGAQANEDRLQVYSPRNELLFEYDPSTGRARVNVADGGLELSTERGDISLNAAGAVRMGGQSIELTGQRLDVKTTHVKWVVERIETLAESIVETAKNAYRTVEQLAQLRAGRMRTLVDETYQFKSKNAFLKAEEDFKVKGDQIHLG